MTMSLWEVVIGRLGLAHATVNLRTKFELYSLTRSKDRRVDAKFTKYVVWCSAVTRA